MRCTARMLGWLLATGCTVGAPPGFSGGDHWSFPLVGPLEDGLLITPVTVGGHGPYLFAFDPDANFSAIDKQVVDDAELRTSGGPKIIDETDTGQIRLYAELVGLKIGDLAIDRRNVLLFPVGYYDTEGRHLSGILGRDVIADSLVFGFDRDQGIATLSTTKAFTPPPDAIAIAYKDLSGGAEGAAGQAAPGGSLVARGAGGRGAAVDSGASVPGRVGGGGGGVTSATISPVPRRLATARIGGATLAMHLDLGAAVSQLSEPRWGDAQLAPAEVNLRLIDEAASIRQVTRAAIGAVSGPADASHVTFVPFIEKRFPPATVDGALGLDFFRRYAVYAHWDRRTFYLKPRGDTAATTISRLGRWSAVLPGCPHAGCVTVTFDDSQGAPRLEVARDAEAQGRPLEVVLGATRLSGGESLSRLLVELPRGVDRISNALPPAYAGAVIAVLDVSPFPRVCAGEGGCVLPIDDSLARGALPREEPAAPVAVPGPTAPSSAPAEASPPAAAPAARTVALDKLRRLSGEPAIAPSDDARKAAGGKPFAVAIVKVCLAADGKVDSTKILKSSGVPAYDDELQRTIKASWTFALGSNPEALCTTATFTAR